MLSYFIIYIADINTIETFLTNPFVFVCVSDSKFNYTAIFLIKKKSIEFIIGTSVALRIRFHWLGSVCMKTFILNLQSSRTASTSSSIYEIRHRMRTLWQRRWGALCGILADHAAKVKQICWLIFLLLGCFMVIFGVCVVWNLSG